MSPPGASCFNTQSLLVDSAGQVRQSHMNNPKYLRIGFISLHRHGKDEGQMTSDIDFAHHVADSRLAHL